MKLQMHTTLNILFRLGSMQHINYNGQILTWSVLTNQRFILFNCQQLANSKICNFQVPGIIPQYIPVILLVWNIKIKRRPFHTIMQNNDSCF